MGNFQRDDNRGGGFRGGNGGGRPNFQKKSWGGSGGDRDTTMHKAVCDECHKSCEVPFRPSGDKPVYCNECFSKKRVNDDRGPRRDFTDRGPKRDFNANPTTQPSFPKPVGVQNDMTKQLADINAKLDRLTSAIEHLVQPKQEIIKAPAIKTVVKALAKKAVTKKKK